MLIQYEVLYHMMKTEASRIDGEKIYLRQMCEEDAPYIVEWRNDPEIRKWMFNQEELTIEKHLEWFNYRRDNRLDYMICLIESGLPIGTVNYTIKDGRVAESGRILGNKEYWGLGYAKEAALLWLKVGFYNFGFKKVIAKTKCENEANIRLNKKLGFVISDKAYIKLIHDRTEEIYIMELSKEDFDK